MDDTGFFLACRQAMLTFRGRQALAYHVISLGDKIIGMDWQTLTRFEPPSTFTIGEIPDFWLRIALLYPIETLLHFYSPRGVSLHVIAD